MSSVFISQFHIGLGSDGHGKLWHEICDTNIWSSIFMKHHNRYCATFLWRIKHYSRLNHLEVNIQNIIIMIWVKYFQEFVHFIITNWFDWNAVHIQNIVICRFKWILWRINLNINIINGIMIKYTHDGKNHRTSFGRRGIGFELICWKLSVPLSWWLSWFITIKVVELDHLSSKTWWEEVRAMYDSVISLVSNYSTSFVNSLLLNVENYNECLESCCSIVGLIWSTKMIKELTWSG